jgi:serine-type D-Ala-D-Ala endopeptidase (penicillin-binding protein 7)
MRRLVGVGRATWMVVLAWGMAPVVALILAGASPGAEAAAKRVAAKKPVAKQAVHASRKRSVKAPSRRVEATRRAVPVRASFGHLAGLHQTDDPLNLRSSVALVVDEDTDEILFSKNPGAVLPIASITKLMTALVVLDAGQPLDEELTISQADVDTHKGSRSRLHVGARLSRGEMLHLALMSSENRAANALGRAYPGGLDAFVAAMNVKAQLLGMADTRFAEPTGLRSDNQSTAQDLARLVRAASQVPLIRELSTAQETAVAVGSRQLEFRNSNALVRDPEWDIRLQKTGYIAEAGRCVVMQAELAGRKLIMVLLDSAGSWARVADAERLRSWLASDALAGAAGAAGATSLR